MKFRRLVLVFILAVVIILYFTKPTKEEFLRFIQPIAARNQTPPVMEYQDKFLYARVIVTFVDTKNLIKKDNHSIAPARKETYVGVFKRYWKLSE